MPDNQPDKETARAGAPPPADALLESDAAVEADAPPAGPPSDPFEPTTTNTLALLQDDTPLDFFLDSIGLYLWPVTDSLHQLGITTVFGLNGIGPDDLIYYGCDEPSARKLCALWRSWHTNTIKALETTQRKSLQSQRDRCGPLHPLTLAKITDLGILLQALEQYDEAESLFEVRYSYHPPTHPPTHPITCLLATSARSHCHPIN